MKKIFLLCTLLASLFAQDNYDFRLAYARADSHDLAYIAIGDMAPDLSNVRAIMIDGGYKYSR